jgi:hypothetical protein
MNPFVRDGLGQPAGLTGEDGSLEPIDALSIG